VKNFGSWGSSETFTPTKPWKFEIKFIYCEVIWLNNSSIHEAAFHEKLVVTLKAKNLSNFYETEMSISMFKSINNRLLCGILFWVIKTNKLVYFIWNILEKTCIFPLCTSISRDE
jgi:hypothetical protein